MLTYIVYIHTYIHIHTICMYTHKEPCWNWWNAIFKIKWLGPCLIASVPVTRAPIDLTKEICTIHLMQLQHLEHATSSESSERKTFNVRISAFPQH